MKDRIIQNILAFIVKDRLQIQTLFVAAFVSVAGVASVKWFGVEMSAETASRVAAVATLLITLILSVISGEVQARGAEKVQQALQVNKPQVEVDGYIGPQTIAAAQDLNIEKVMGPPRNP